MLDGLLGRGGFASKCKSLMKLTKTRIDVIRRKRNATQKFLRKDVADLLSNGLDINAFGRAEGLLVEVILSSCYDFVERCCDVVLKHISAMQKHKECPEECKSAVASLMLAAARFSDLPELRDLRQMFYERYGNSLVLFEDADFKANLASAPTTLENKVWLVKEIALEFSIKWDSKAFEQRMSKPPLSPQEPPKAQRHFNRVADKSNSSHGKDKVLSIDGQGIFLKERFDHDDGHSRPRKEKEVSTTTMDANVDFQTRLGLSSNGHDKSPNGLNDAIPKNIHENCLQGRREYGPDRHAQVALNLKEDNKPKFRSGGSSQRKIGPSEVGPTLHHGRENNIDIMDNRDALPNANLEITTPHTINGDEKFAEDKFGGGHQLRANYSSKDEAIPKPRSFHNMLIPPPYVKHYDKARVRKQHSHLGSGSDGGLDGNLIPKDSLNPDRGHRSGHERQLSEPEKASPHRHEEGQIYNDGFANPLPKPRSSRRRHSRSHSFQNDMANFEEAGPALPRKSRSKRRDDSRRGLQVLFDNEHNQQDEEDRIIDKLLLHYSKKPSSTDDSGKPRRRSKSRHSNLSVNDADEFPKNGTMGGSDNEMSVHHSRSVSLPREHSGPSTATKVFTRAATFQLDRSDGARHVHPKLPDYDELAARFAALRGR